MSGKALAAGFVLENAALAHRWLAPNATYFGSTIGDFVGRIPLATVSIGSGWAGAPCWLRAELPGRVAGLPQGSRAAE